MIGATIILAGTLAIAAHAAHWARAERLSAWLYTAAIILMAGAGIAVAFAYPELAVSIAAAGLLGLVAVVAAASLVVWWEERR